MDDVPLRLGLSGEAVDRYVDEWTVAINDITPVVHRIRDHTTHLIAARWGRTSIERAAPQF